MSDSDLLPASPDRIAAQARKMMVKAETAAEIAHAEIQDAIQRHNEAKADLYDAEKHYEHCRIHADAERKKG